ncbi:DUF1868 domain-containing protein [Nostoc spongiaeforme FACHB-130]|uniref:DUF1868 domain-containing protein n=1 Tax=Nostoc spongiaeforme FACHB-130 TaxID=1357510 RepID=A0ABR8G1Z0_9NOSO|nr:DUF1868 domain-containing protein [Nostoc spongiaeforme]MBD2597259.1 DUF1868 domain-containing protein [Nostoc spongiaeforme FACHB-130]
MDDNYQTYLNRVARMMLPESYKTQVQHIQESSKFLPTSGTRQAAPFPGYTLITPTAEEAAENAAFYATLTTYQQQLLQLPVNQDLIVPVPPASFHLTLADLIWDHAYLDACEKNPKFEEELRHYCEEIFQQYQQTITPGSKPIYWQMLGLVLMPRALAVCLVPKDESSYEQIIQFRRTIYQNPKLIALGIEQHYHLTAHITLGYFGDIVPDLDRNKFSDLLAQLNQQWLENSPEFLVNRVELRKFDDMTRYYREPDWPSLDF